VGDAAIIGLISDTHGLLRPDALTALKGSDLIIHAGDVGNQKMPGKDCLPAPTASVSSTRDIKAFKRKRLILEPCELLNWQDHEIGTAFTAIYRKRTATPTLKGVPLGVASLKAF
jgi:hypothetical protein